MYKTLHNVKLSCLKSISLVVLDYCSAYTPITDSNAGTMFVGPLDAQRWTDCVPSKRQGTIYPVTRRHIPEDRIPQPHLCENLQTRYIWYHLEAKTSCTGYVSQPTIRWTGQLCAAPMTKWNGQICHIRKMAKGRDQFTAWAWEEIWPLLEMGIFKNGMESLLFRNSCIRK